MLQALQWYKPVAYGTLEAGVHGAGVALFPLLVTPGWSDRPPAR